MVIFGIHYLRFYRTLALNIIKFIRNCAVHLKCVARADFLHSCLRIGGGDGWCGGRRRRLLLLSAVRIEIALEELGESTKAACDANTALRIHRIQHPRVWARAIVVADGVHAAVRASTVPVRALVDVSNKRFRAIN